jgi:hypothetical protein
MNIQKVYPSLYTKMIKLRKSQLLSVSTLLVYIVTLFIFGKRLESTSIINDFRNAFAFVLIFLTWLSSGLSFLILFVRILHVFRSIFTIQINSTLDGIDVEDLSTEMEKYIYLRLVGASMLLVTLVIVFQYVINNML